MKILKTLENENKGSLRANWYIRGNTKKAE